MTIEQYIQGKVDFNLSEPTIGSVLLDRGIAESTDASDVTEKQRELAIADIYMFLASASTSTSGKSESDGGWSHSEGAKNVYNRGAYVSRAKAIYEKWGECVPSNDGKVRLSNLY